MRMRKRSVGKAPLRGQSSHRNLPAGVLALRERYVTIAGEIATVVVEQEDDERKIDHIWITVRSGEFGHLQISLSTCSRQSRAAGLDARIRLGSVVSEWTALPPAGVREVPPLDYRSIESQYHVDYTPHERQVVEEMILTRARRAVFAEAWGDFYVSTHIGVHQIHSRRTSSAVRQDVVGRDGLVQFYYREGHMREMLLFKFAGQP